MELAKDAFGNDAAVKQLLIQLLLIARNPSKGEFFWTGFFYFLWIIWMTSGRDLLVDPRDYPQILRDGRQFLVDVLRFISKTSLDILPVQLTKVLLLDALLVGTAWFVIGDCHKFLDDFLYRHSL